MQAASFFMADPRGNHIAIKKWQSVGAQRVLRRLIWIVANLQQPQ
jgi:hypothetical protein